MPNYHSTCNKLRDYDLEAALRSISYAAGNDFQRQDIVDKAQAIKEDYQRMQNIFVHGRQDDKREELFDQLFERTWALDSELCYLSQKQERKVEEVEGSLEMLLERLTITPSDDTALGEVFEKVLAAHPMSNEERQLIHLSILDEQLPTYVRATLLSSLTLYLQVTFDSRIIENLYTYTLDDQPIQLQMQSWVTLVLVAFWYSDRIAHLPRIKEQYCLLCESNPQLLREIQKSLLLSEQARTIQGEIQEILNDDNPDIDSPGMVHVPEEKMLKLQEFFREVGMGVDLSYASFMQFCKHRYFSNTGCRHHWLEPFSCEQPHVKRILEQNPEFKNLLQLLTNASNQCSTDKYIAVLCMPQLQDNLMAQISQKLADLGMNFDQPASENPVSVMQIYVQDLYRYFTLHPYLSKEDHRMMMKEHWLLSTNPWLYPSACSVDQLRGIAEFCFQHHLKEPVQAEAFSELLKSEKTELYYLRLAKVYDPILKAEDRLRVLSECIDHFDGCIEAYIMLSDSYNRKRLYFAEKNLLENALRHAPEQEELLWRMGRCQINLEHPSQAMEPLFKADLAHEGNHNTQIQLARALFRLGKLDQAVRYAELAIEHSEIDERDRGRAGIIFMATGDYQRAYDSLKTSTLLFDEEIFSHVGKLVEPYHVQMHDLTLMRTLMLQYNNDLETNHNNNQYGIQL